MGQSCLGRDWECAEVEREWAGGVGDKVGKAGVRVVCGSSQVIGSLSTGLREPTTVAITVTSEEVSWEGTSRVER